MDTQKKWVVPLMIWVVFETVAVTLWLTKDNLFYLFNFSYIGSAIAIGFLLLSACQKDCPAFCGTVYASVSGTDLQ